MGRASSQSHSTLMPVFLWDNFWLLNQLTAMKAKDKERGFQGELIKLRPNASWALKIGQISDLRRWEARVCLPVISSSWFCCCFPLIQLDTQNTIPRAPNSTNTWEKLCSSKNHIYLAHRDTVLYTDCWLQLAVPWENCGQRYSPCPGFWRFVGPGNFLECCHSCPGPPNCPRADPPDLFS